MTTEISVKKVEVLEQWKGSGILEDNEGGQASGDTSTPQV